MINQTELTFSSSRNVRLPSWSFPLASSSLVSSLSAPTLLVCCNQGSRIPHRQNYDTDNNADFFSLAGLDDPFLCTVILS